MVVNQPLADATTVVWPVVSDDDSKQSAELIGGRLTLMADLETARADETDRGHLVDIIARTETGPSLLGVSQHLLAVG